MPPGPPTPWGPQSSGQAKLGEDGEVFMGWTPARGSEQLLELCISQCQWTSQEPHLYLCDAAWIPARPRPHWDVALLVRWREALTRYLKALSNQWAESVPTRSYPTSPTALHNPHLRQRKLEATVGKEACRTSPVLTIVNSGTTEAHSLPPDTKPSLHLSQLLPEIPSAPPMTTSRLNPHFLSLPSTAAAG